GDRARLRAREGHGVRGAGRVPPRRLGLGARAAGTGAPGVPWRGQRGVDRRGAGRARHGVVARGQSARRGGAARGGAPAIRARARRAHGGPLPPSVRAWSAGRHARDRERTSRSADDVLVVWDSITGPRAPAVPPAPRQALDGVAPRRIRAARLQRALAEGTLL